MIQTDERSVIIISYLGNTASQMVHFTGKTSKLVGMALGLQA